MLMWPSLRMRKKKKVDSAISVSRTQTTGNVSQTMAENLAQNAGVDCNRRGESRKFGFLYQRWFL